MRFPSWLKVYGDRSYRGDCPSEVLEHVTLFNALRREWPNTIGRLAFHPRNEGKRDWRTTARDKAEGMTPGTSDLIIPGAPTLVLELKRRDHTRSKLSKAELEYLQIAHQQGCHACVALGWEAAMDAIRAWSGPA